MSRRAEIEINKTKMLPNETYRYNGRPFITGKTGKFEKFVTNNKSKISYDDMLQILNRVYEKKMQNETAILHDISELQNVA